MVKVFFDAVRSIWSSNLLLILVTFLGCTVFAVYIVKSYMNAPGKPMDVPLSFLKILLLVGLFLFLLLFFIFYIFLFVKIVAIIWAICWLL